MNQVGYDNSNGICTSSHESNCTGCSISGKLKCRLNVVDWLKFLLLFSVFLVPGLIGIIMQVTLTRLVGCLLSGYFFLVSGR